MTSKQYVNVTQVLPRLAKNDCIGKVEPVTRKCFLRGNKSSWAGGDYRFSLIEKSSYFVVMHVI